MHVMLTIKTIRVLAMLLLPAAAATAQTPAIEPLQAKMDSLLQQYDLTVRERQQLSARADSLAQIVQARKQQDRNLVEARLLEADLQRSQQLSRRLQALQERENQLFAELVQFSETTLKKLNNDIGQISRALKRAPKHSAVRDTLARHLQQAMALRTTCQTILAAAPIVVAITPVQVDSSDSPRKLAQKADFVRDQADRLKRAAGKMETRVAELRDEIYVRERLADFVDDLAMFDPSNENVSTSASSADRSTTLLPETEAGNRPPNITDLSGSVAALTGSILATPADWTKNVGELSPAEIRALIDKLSRQQKAWLAKADSLEQRANQIERAGRQAQGKKD